MTDDAATRHPRQESKQPAWEPGAPTLTALQWFFSSGWPAKLGTGAALTWIALAYHLGKDGNAKVWPSLTTLSRETGMTRYHVWQNLNRLEAVGLIEREPPKDHKGRKSTTYTLTSLEKRLVSKGDQSLKETSTSLEKRPVTSLQRGPDPIIYEPTMLTDQSLAPATPSPSSQASPVAGEERASPSRRKGSKKKKDAELPDPRVRPVQDAFVAAFRAATGHEPTRLHFHYGRDGKRIRELPASYTTDVLVDAVARFFDSPDYVRRNLSFMAFLDALPRLVKGDAANAERRRGRYVETREDRDGRLQADWLIGKET